MEPTLLQVHHKTPQELLPHSASLFVLRNGIRTDGIDRRANDIAAELASGQ